MKNKDIKQYGDVCRRLVVAPIDPETKKYFAELVDEKQDTYNFKYLFEKARNADLKIGLGGRLRKIISEGLSELKEKKAIIKKNVDGQTKGRVCIVGSIDDFCKNAEGVCEYLFLHYEEPRVKKIIIKVFEKIAGGQKLTEHICNSMFASYEAIKPTLVILFTIFNKTKPTKIITLIKKIETSLRDEKLFRKLFHGDKKYIEIQVQSLEKKKEKDLINSDSYDNLIRMTKQMELSEEDKRKLKENFHKSLNILLGSEVDTQKKGEYTQTNFKKENEKLMLRYKEYEDIECQAMFNEKEISRAEIIPKVEEMVAEAFPGKKIATGIKTKEMIAEFKHKIKRQEAKEIKGNEKLKRFEKMIEIRQNRDLYIEFLKKHKTAGKSKMQTAKAFGFGVYKTVKEFEQGLKFRKLKWKDI